MTIMTYYLFTIKNSTSQISVYKQRVVYKLLKF